MTTDTLPALLVAVADALAAGRDPEPAAVTALAGTTDILALGALADDARRARHGQQATFARVHELVLGSADAWSAAPEAAGEVRLSGRAATLAEAVAATVRARTLAGDRVLRGFWLRDVDAWPDASPDAFAALRAAGLDGIAFVDVAAASAARLVEARAAGLSAEVIASDAVPLDRLAWLLEARRLAAQAGGIRAVAPLPRQIDRAEPTTGFDDVRTVALARLLLDGVPSIQVDWARYGPKLAQVALSVGADDLDGVTATDDSTLGPRRAPAEDVRRNIAAAGLTAAERDGRWALCDR